MNGDLAYEVQEAIFKALCNTPAVATLVTPEGGAARISDCVPDEEEFEHIQIGDVTWADHGDKTDPGQDGIFALHIWTRRKGNKNLYLIGRQINLLFHEQPLVLVAGAVTLLRHSSSVLVRDPDGRSRQLVKNFRIITTDPLT